MRLSNDLTFEEFEALANRHPNLRGSWIYMVTQAICNNDLKYPYPKFELEFHKEIYFKTFHTAEKFIKKNTENVYCSWITQIPYGIETGYDGYGAEWLYDNQGQLLDYTITQGYFGAPEDYTFFGRPRSRQRFKVGDIVEVVSRKSVRLAVLNSQIPDVEMCWAQYKYRDDEIGFYYRLDYSDDSAIVIDGPNYYDHDHVSPLYLLSPRFKIPEDIKAEMLTWNDRCNAATEKEENATEEENFVQDGAYRRDYLKEKGDRAGEFYKLNIYVHFDENGKNPHLHINDHYGLKVALRIDQPEYYDHDDYIGRLNPNQIQSLMKYLTRINQGKTKWWYLLRNWNEDNDNPHLTLPLNTPLPDFLKLLV